MRSECRPIDRLGKTVVDTYNLNKVGDETFGIHDSFDVVKMGGKETVLRSKIDSVTTEEGSYILTDLAQKLSAQLADAGCPAWSLSVETSIDVQTNNFVVRVTGLQLTEKLKG